MASLQTESRRIAGERGSVARALSAGDAPRDWHDPRYQAFAIMRLAFTVAPIAFGLDKFFNVLVEWPKYLAPWINDIAPAPPPPRCTWSAWSRSSPASSSR
jgi:hypothetical protein